MELSVAERTRLRALLDAEQHRRLSESEEDEMRALVTKEREEAHGVPWATVLDIALEILLS